MNNPDFRDKHKSVRLDEIFINLKKPEKKNIHKE